MSRAAIFIDGAYFDHVIRDELDGARIDFSKLVRKMVADLDLLRAYYYHCLPYQSQSPTPEEQERFSRAQKFYKALERLPRFEVRRGKLEYRGRTEEGKPIFIQKRVDLALGVDLVRLAVSGRITHALLIAGDSDLLPAIEVAKADGVSIHLFHGRIHRPHEDLWSTADERTALTKRFVSDTLR